MMRVYSSILMSSLLLSCTAVNAQSLEARSTFLSPDNFIPQIIIDPADTQSCQADTDKETLPERGSGR
ncbi:hypothetical protein IQ270_01725 [Microcoleus sp. LEGE 07076]|uniref:heterocyst-inhibiting protein PatX n=1 Tax=Microcoleus sp. LEGE 07076 TaxID=915322 RepID=UPI0018810B32|nr:hypothetical protein [Microcoleus sp. LEGE 07076]MBE9183479.1 hypothetical protein [Microcoleus sp. LEGE 07076]